MREKVYNKLTESIEDWEFDAYHAKHKSGLRYWTANGFMVFHLDGSTIDVHLGLWYKFRLWLWIKWAKQEKLLTN